MASRSGEFGGAVAAHTGGFSLMSGEEASKINASRGGAVETTIPKYNPAEATPVPKSSNATVEADLSKESKTLSLEEADAAEAEKEDRFAAESKRLSRDASLTAFARDTRAQQAIETNSMLEKKSRAKKIAANQVETLGRSATPGLTTTPPPVVSSGTKAKDVHRDLMAAYHVLRDHIDKLPAAIESRAQQHEDAANTIAEKDPKHPLVSTYRGIAADLRSQVNVHTLREQKENQNNLVEAKTKLDRVLAEGPDGLKVDGRFKDPTEMPTPDVHANLKMAANLLSRVHRNLNSSALSIHGVGSPISTGQMKDIVGRSQNLLSRKSDRKTEPVQVKAPADIERDVHPVTGEQASPGHIWWNTANPSESFEVKATKENLRAYQDSYGKNHADLPRLKAMVSEAYGKTAPKVQTYAEDQGRPVKEVAVPVTDESGKDLGMGKARVRTNRAPIVPKAPLRANRETVKKRMEEQRASKPATPTKARYSSKPFDEALIGKAQQHLMERNIIPGKLRRLLGTEGIAEAMRRAGVTRSN